MFTRGWEESKMADVCRLMPILDSSLAASDEVKERDGRMVITSEMESDTNVDRGTVGARMA